jgi:hypothetical protein
MRLGYFALAVLLLSPLANAGSGNGKFSVEYEGGNLALKQHKVLKATLGADEVILKQGGRQFTLSSGQVVSVIEGSQQRRTGFIHGIGPLRERIKTEHYVGVSWGGKAADGNGASEEIVFKVRESKYPAFLASLEELTGKKAINADKTGLTVHYAPEVIRPRS